MKFRSLGIGKLSRTLAAVFLALMVFEFASHGMICVNRYHSEEPAVVATDYGHDDPCQTLVMCSQSRQRDQQQPRFGHETVQHNGLVGLFDINTPLFDPCSSRASLHSSTREIFRPPDPPFQPPEN